VARAVRSGQRVRSSAMSWIWAGPLALRGELRDGATGELWGVDPKLAIAIPTDRFHDTFAALTY
jgi:hypothetical protein